MNPAPTFPALPPDDNQPLHLKWIAAFLGISVKTVRRMLDRQVMPSRKMNGLRVVIRRDFKVDLDRLTGGGSDHARL